MNLGGLYCDQRLVIDHIEIPITFDCGSIEGLLCADLVAAERIHGFSKTAFWLAELNHRRLEVAQRPFDETIVIFVVSKEVMPKRVLQPN